MYLLVMKYNKDGTFIGADLGEEDKDWKIWYLDGKIHEADYPIIPNKNIREKLEELIERYKGPYEVKDKFYGNGRVLFYLMDKLENPIKEKGQEREVAEELIKYYKGKKWYSLFKSIGQAIYIMILD